MEAAMRHQHWIALDLETAIDDTARDLLEEPQADKRLTDPVKITADIEAKWLAQIERMALDPYAGRIVAIGCQTERHAAPECVACESEEMERLALRDLAATIRVDHYQGIQRHIVGYRCWRFDLPFLMTRARLLGVEFPELDMRRYGNRDMTDLYSLLTFDGSLQDGVIRRSLTTMARRFGIPVDDDTRGSDIAALVHAGDWDAITAHCRSDVALTVALAQRLGVLALSAVEATA